MNFIKQVLFYFWSRNHIPKEIEALPSSGLNSFRYKIKHYNSLLQEDDFLSHQFEKRFLYFRIRTFFVTVFILFSIYVLTVKEELYLSTSSLLVKDISENSVTGLAAGFLGLGSSSQSQDAGVVETYLSSMDVLKKLDQKFHLRKYYETDFIDPLHRLYGFSSEEYFLELYRSDLEITYDETSGIISIGFAHADPAIAQAIVQFLIIETENQLNLYNHRNAQKQLEFVSSIVENNRLKLDAATKQLEMYQNKHKMLDPSTDAAALTGVLTNLETSLEQKRLEYKQLSNYMNETSFEMVRLANEITEMEKQLGQVRSRLADQHGNPLNVRLFDFEKIKNQVEFEKEVYKESLLQLEVAKVDIYKQAKTMVVLTNPVYPDTFTYPRILVLLTGMLVGILLLYGITMQIVAIVEDHEN